MLFPPTVRHLVWTCLLSASASVAGAAETRIAIVLAGSKAQSELAIQLANVRLNEEGDIATLERDKLQRVFQEHSLSIQGFVAAPQAVQIGQLLRVDLFVIVTQPPPQAESPAHLLAFDAASGVRLLDTTLTGAAPEAMSTSIVAAVRQAVTKYRAAAGDVRTVSLLTLRNADLPRSFDSTVHAFGRMLERRLVQAPPVAVLERTFLQQTIRENQQIGEPPRPLLTSLRLINVELSRDGSTGLSATVTLKEASGEATASWSVRSENADLAEMIESLTDRILPAIASGSQKGTWDRTTEAAYYYSESELLHEHAEFERAAASAAAALALQPENLRYMQMLVRRLSDAAIDCVDPGRQTTPGPARKPVGLDDLQASLPFGQHAFEVNRELALRRLQNSETDQLIENALQTYLSKLAVPLDQQTAATRQASQDFIANFQAFEIEMLEGRLRARAVHSEQAFGQYTSWLARPAMLNLFMRYRHFDDRAIQHVPRLLSEWTKLLERWPLQDDDQRTSNTQFLFSEIGWLQREAARDATAYSQLHDAYRKLQRHDDPFVQCFGLNLEILLDGYAGRGTVDQIRSSVARLSEQAVPLIPQDPLSRRHQPFVHMVLQAQNLLPLDERTPSHREFHDALVSAGKYSPYLVDQIIRNYEREGQTPQRRSFIDSAITQLQSPHLVFADAFSKHEVERLQKWRSQFGPLDTPPGPWKSYRTLVDYHSNDRDTLPRALIEPVLHNRHVYALQLRFDLQHPWAEFTLRRFDLDQDNHESLGTYRIDDLPRPEDHRAEAGNFHWVIERSTSAGSTFIRSVCVAQQTYFAATMGRGLWAFPLAGGPPRSIDEADGLPSQHVQAIVYQEGFLYGWAGQPDTSAYFFRIRPDGSEPQVLASSRRGTPASSLDNTKPARCDFMTVDAPRDRIVFRLTDDSSHDVLGLWEYKLSSGKFRQLWQTPRFLARGKDVRRLDPDGLWITDQTDLYRFDLETDTPIKRFELQTTTPWMFRPFAIEGDEIWEGSRFVRMDMRTGQQTPMPPLREGTFQPGVFAQPLPPNHWLLADPAGLWLIQLE